MLTIVPSATGHGDSNGKNLPTMVKDVSGIGQVACGSSHTIIVSQDGRTVWSFGGGDNGTVTCVSVSISMSLLVKATQLYFVKINGYSSIKTCYDVN